MANLPVIWLNPAAWLAVVIVAAPVLVHLLVHRRAETFPFPTLRFIQPTRLAAIHRRALDDLVLLAVRSAILVGAVAAAAGPLIVTSARRASWNQRVVRAIVAYPGAGRGAQDVVRQATTIGEPFRTEYFAAALPDGIRRAVAWLEAAPPARRELVVVAPLVIGSVTDAEIAAVPDDIGIRFERTGTLPAERTVAAQPVLAGTDVLRRTVTLAGKDTSVRDDRTAESGSWPVEIVAPTDARPAMDAAIHAVLSQHVWMRTPERQARLLLVRAPVDAPTMADAGPIRLPWMADAAAHISRDADLQAEAARMRMKFADPRFVTAPWQPLLTGAEGVPIVSAAASPRMLIVASGADAADFLTPLLLRSIANSLAPSADLARFELLPIPEGQLRAWSRPPGTPRVPRVDTVDQDDRRWLWGGVLVLLVLETWMRRARVELSPAIEQEQEPARVG